MFCFVADFMTVQMKKEMCVTKVLVWQCWIKLDYNRMKLWCNYIMRHPGLCKYYYITSS